LCESDIDVAALVERGTIESTLALILVASPSWS